MEFIKESFTLDLRTTLIDFLRVGVAFALALPIAWERYRSERNIGLRTFPLVAVGACGFTLIAKHAPGADADTQARILRFVHETGRAWPDSTYGKYARHQSSP